MGIDQLYKKLLILLALSTAYVPSLACAQDVVFIINKDNPIAKLSAAQVQEMFFKKKREWPDGTTVRFIDRPDGTPIRQKFLSSIIRKSDRDVDLYWIGQKLYSGSAAPQQVAKDKSVADLVGQFKGGIGYVMGGTPIKNAKVKPVEVSP